jgi:hypothetical protein
MLHTNEVKPYENNPRNNAKAVDKVAASIKEFGFKIPIVIDENNVIVAGHTRHKAAEMLELKKIPCIKASDLTPEQVKAYRLVDNKTAELSVWDFAKLEEEMSQITEIDMDSFGFDFAEEIGDDYDDTVPELSMIYSEQYGVLVTCEDETEQERIYNELTQKGYECKVVAT